jgi:predicted DNA-binding transcriptional regulator YafY
MKIDRLISIITLLLRKEKVKAQELADRYEVSVRTILRDIETINQAGIPIVTYRGSNGGIGIAEGFRIDKSVLNYDEMASIIALRNGINSISTSQSDGFLEKMKSNLNQDQIDTLNRKSSQLVIDLSPWGNSQLINDKLEHFRKAIKESLEVTIKYADFNGTLTERKIEPYTLILKGQNWYLHAFCRLRDAFRLFKVSRIRELTLLESTYTARELPELLLPANREWSLSEEMVEIDMVFEDYMESIIEEWFSDEFIRDDKGSLLISLKLPLNNWFYSFILSMGPGVEVLKPLHVRETIAEMAEKIYKKHVK